MANSSGAMLGYGFAILAIVAAVLLTVARLALPYLETYRDALEGWASEQIGQPLRIGAVDARLLGLSPTLVLQDVALLDDSGSIPIARFDEARIGLRVTSSLRQRRLVLSGLTIAGAELELVRQVDGRLGVHGWLPGTQAGAGNGAVGQWLLEQPRITLKDCRVRWRDLASPGPQVTLHALELELANVSDRHRLHGTLVMPPEVGGQARLAAELTGDLAASGGWAARAYLAAQGVRPSGWRDLPEFQGMRLQGGEFDVNLWGNWANGRLATLEGEAAVRQLSVRSSTSQHIFAINRLATILRWEHEAGAWSLDLDELYLERAGRSWERARVRVEHAEGAQRVFLSYADLRDVAQALELGEWLAPEQRETLRALRVGGTLRGLRVDVAEKGFALQSDIHNLSYSPEGRLPGLKGVGGRLRLDQDGGELQLASRGLALEAPALFRKPLLFDSVEGVIRAKRHGTGWEFDTSEITLANRDVNARLGLRLRLPEGQTPLLDLRGEFERADATRIPNYLPVGIMAPSAVAWLTNAFQAGSAQEGVFAVLGPVNRFPFAGGEGNFTVQFGVRGVELAYHPDWPRFEGVDGELHFNGAGMAIRVARARVFDWRLAGVEVDIPNLRRAVLTAKGGGKGSAGGGLRFLRESALSKRLDGVLSQLAAAGPASVTLALTLPLTSNAKEPLRLSGEVQLRRSQLTVSKRLPLRELTGVLHFTEVGLGTEGVEGELFGGRLALSLENETGVTRVRAAGTAKAEEAAPALQVPLLDRVHGDVQWQALYTVPHNPGEGGTELKVSADLSRAVVELPAPAAGSEFLQLSVKLGGKQHGTVQLRLDDRLSLAAEPDQDGALRRAALQIGGGIALLPDEPQIYVGGFAEGLDVAAWSALLPKGGAGGSSRLPPVVIEMERLHLAVLPEKNGREGGSEGEVWRSLPPLQIDIARFGYGTLEVGRVLLKTRWTGPDTLRIHDFLLVGPQMRINGEGEWVQTRTKGTTSFRLKGASQNLGASLENLGYHGVMRGGKAEISGELRWAGSPLAMRYEDLAGQFHLRIDKGVVQELEPGAGRLLGLLSLQALPSRLLFDFSDVFGKGYEFSRIEGDVRFEKGNGYTDNMLVTASTSEVLITGRTGFVARDFDQLVTVVPNVSGSLPVAGGLAWGPQVGAVLLVLQKLFFSKLDEAAAFQYRVTGTWDEPKVVRLNAPAVESTR